VILSNFRKTRSVAYRIFFKNTEKETANQTVELISDKNKNFGKKTDFFKKILQSTIFLILFLKTSRRIVPQ